jgi:transposase
MENLGEKRRLVYALMAVPHVTKIAIARSLDLLVVDEEPPSDTNQLAGIMLQRAGQLGKLGQLRTEVIEANLDLVRETVEPPVVQPRERYSTDVTDEQWAAIEPLIPKHRTGAPRKTDMREVLNAVNYKQTAQCTWRMLPHDFRVSLSTVQAYYSAWQELGLLGTFAELSGLDAIKQTSRSHTVNAFRLTNQMIYGLCGFGDDSPDETMLSTINVRLDAIWREVLRKAESIVIVTQDDLHKLAIRLPNAKAQTLRGQCKPFKSIDAVSQTVLDLQSYVDQFALKLSEQGQLLFCHTPVLEHKITRGAHELTLLGGYVIPQTGASHGSQDVREISSDGAGSRLRPAGRQGRSPDAERVEAENSRDDFGLKPVPIVLDHHDYSEGVG